MASHCPRNKVGSVIESAQTQDREESAHFLSDANMSEENVLVSDLKEVTLSSVKELITIVFSLRALYDLNQMKDLA